MKKHVLIETMELSRTLYEEMLCQSLYIEEFQTKNAAILDTNPYFIPSYLEMLWRADERRDVYLQKKLHAHVSFIVKQIMRSPQLQRELAGSWSKLEFSALRELLGILKKSPVLSHMDRFFMHVVLSVLHYLISPQVEQPIREPKYMVLTKKIDPLPLQQELSRIAPYWWQINTERQEYIIHHQHTWALVLRKLVSNNPEFKRIDGNHESVKANIVEWFPVIHNTVLNLAKDLNLGLGRVAIVMMKPWSQAYRHYDFEKFLIGRDRYHLVVQCGENNVLSSGVDTIIAKPGDVWLFDNKAMHRAENKSSQPRYHVIFDGYPLDKLNA